MKRLPLQNMLEQEGDPDVDIFLESDQFSTNGYAMICIKLMDHVFKVKKCLTNCRVVERND